MPLLNILAVALRQPPPAGKKSKRGGAPEAGSLAHRGRTGRCPGAMRGGLADKRSCQGGLGERMQD
jgi:hypothetical protein